MAALKELKKGSTVILCGFTGMKLGVYTVTGATKTTITIEKADGTELEFSRKTGKQINVAEGKERYANFIIEDDGSYENPLEKARKGKKKADKKAAKKASKKASEDVEDEIEEDEDEEEEAPAKKKASKKKASKKSAKKVVEDEEDEDDEDEYEEDEE